MAAPTAKPRNPLEPLASVVGWAFRLAVVAAVARVISALLGRGPMFGWGGGPSDVAGSVCMNTAGGLLQHTGSGLSHSGMGAGISANWTTANVCVAHPTISQSLAAMLTQLPTTLLFLGALYFAQRLTRIAARDGVYTAQAARLLLILGWWLLAGELAATAIEALARMSLLSQLVTWTVDWGQWFVAWYLSWPVVFIGLGLITLARVMRIGVSMRADLEGTV
jgi:hypothetical protein